MKEQNEYLHEEEVKAEGSPVELSYSLYTHFGSHDCRTEGISLREVALEDGQVLPAYCDSEDWKEIAPGIEVKDILTYGSASRKSSRLIRIQPSACPVTLWLDRILEYSTSDYPHRGEHSSKRYSIRVVE